MLRTILFPRRNFLSSNISIATIQYGARYMCILFLRFQQFPKRAFKEAAERGVRS